MVGNDLWMHTDGSVLKSFCPQLRWSMIHGPQIPMYWIPKDSIYVIFPLKLSWGKTLSWRTVIFIKQWGLHHHPEMLDSSEMLTDNLWRAPEVYYMKDFREVFNLVLFFPWERLQIPGWKSTCSKSNDLCGLKMFPFVIRPLPQVL